MDQMQTMETKDLLGRLAVITAMEKAVKAAKDEIRSECDNRVFGLAQQLGVGSVNMTVGDETVGKITICKPAVGYSGDAFGRWAYENGMGSFHLDVDLSMATFEPEALDEIIDQLEGYGAKVHRSYSPTDFAKKSVEVVSGRVICKDTGEEVPGAYVKRPQTRVTGCKPAEVGRAMRIAGETVTVSGLLEG